MAKKDRTIQPVKLTDNQFLNEKDGSLVLPSLMTLDQEKSFEISNNWFVDGKSRIDSLREIREFDMADEYRSIYLELTQTEEFLLKFIALFKSVQKIHLIREATLFPEIVNPSKINSSLKHLFVNNLIWKWKYHHPVYANDIEVYTLSTNGYYMLKLISGNEHYFFPGLLLSRKIPAVFHVRFWETVDLYQLFVSLPSYKGSTTLFNGGHLEDRIVNSPLQIATRLLPGKTVNLIVYPVLQTDGDSYYNHVIEKWLEFTEKGKVQDKPVNSLPGESNVLTFYAPTGDFANQFNKHFQLNKAPFPIFYIIGSLIREYGIEQSFFAPSATNDVDKSIEQISGLDLLQEEDNNA